jgi:hypothetical protein
MPRPGTSLLPLNSADLTLSEDLILETVFALDWRRAGGQEDTSLRYGAFRTEAAADILPKPLAHRLELH